RDRRPVELRHLATPNGILVIVQDVELVHRPPPPSRHNLGRTMFSVKWHSARRTAGSQPAVALISIVGGRTMQATIRSGGLADRLEVSRGEGGMPDRSDEFRKLATDCVAIARTTADPGNRAIL